MGVYQKDPDRRPDTDFEPGKLHHLVPGNRGRVMDTRRTPVEVARLRPECGTFLVEITAFEDKGALWEEPYESVGHYQFEKGCPRADAGVLSAAQEAIERLDRSVTVPADPEAGEKTRARLAQERSRADAWLERHSKFFPGEAAGLDPASGATTPDLWADLRGYVEVRGVWDLEEPFAHQFVSNPYSGDLVKGHRIVLAELGLVTYADKVPRDPDIFTHPWTRERRAEHIIARMGFVYAALVRAGMSTVELYRGMSVRDRLEPPRNVTFVSSTFSRQVAESHFESGKGDGDLGILYRQRIPAERVFMTYLETEAMNLQFKEVEAVLLFEEKNPAF